MKNADLSNNQYLHLKHIIKKIGKHTASEHSYCQL